MKSYEKRAEARTSVTMATPSELRVACQKADLSVPKYDLLTLLEDNSGQMVRKVAQYTLGLDSASLSRMVKDLESKYLIYVAPRPEEGCRGTVLGITPKGKAMVTAIYQQGRWAR